MSTEKFTNTHIHIFNTQCVPHNFLRVVPQKTLRKIAPQLISILSSSGGKAIIQFLAKRGAEKGSAQYQLKDKFISFLNIGLQNRQQDVFEIEYKTTRSVDPEARMVVLTMNMDYMDDVTPPMNFVTQIEDVKNIKRYYADSFFPFYGIDPRHLSGQSGLKIVKEQMETGINDKGTYYPYFVGLKLYPALGYFPFDKRLMEVYKYAEDNLIPLMSHCTRVGSQYIGRDITNLIPKKLDSLFPPLINDRVSNAKNNIEARIDAYYKKGWIKTSEIGDNDFACDLFGHPENYIPLLEHFPNLKICLAHMGGSNEIDVTKKDASLNAIREKIDPVPWFDLIKDMMYNYPNMYTDISYTLSSFAEKNQVVLNKTIALMQTPDKNGQPLAYRILFGTDFFMTEQEMREKELLELAKVKMSGLTTTNGENYWDLLTRQNPKNYLNF